MYQIVFSQKAEEDLRRLKKSDHNIFKKAIKLIEELMIHPKTGKGKPTLKKYNLKGCYSRKLSKKHRLVYAIDQEKGLIDILSVKGHYQDK